MDAFRLIRCVDFANEVTVDRQIKIAGEFFRVVKIDNVMKDKYTFYLVNADGRHVAQFTAFADDFIEVYAEL